MPKPPRGRRGQGPLKEVREMAVGHSAYARTRYHRVSRWVPGFSLCGVDLAASYPDDKEYLLQNAHPELKRCPECFGKAGSAKPREASAD